MLNIIYLINELSFIKPKIRMSISFVAELRKLTERAEEERRREEAKVRAEQLRVKREAAAEVRAEARRIQRVAMEEQRKKVPLKYLAML